MLTSLNFYLRLINQTKLCIRNSLIEIHTKSQYTASQNSQASVTETYNNKYTENAKTEHDVRYSEQFPRHRGLVQVKPHSIARSKSEAEMRKQGDPFSGREK